MTDLKTIIGYVVLFVAIVSICIGGWYVGRKVHYSFAYKTMVEETVKEMVKGDCLR